MPAVTTVRAPATAITSQHVSNTSPLRAPSAVAAFAAYLYKGELAGGCKKITGANKSLSSSSIVACESNLPALPTLSISRSSRFGSHQPLHACSSKGAITRLPAWFIMIYCYFAYIGIVKNKDFPHFFRFHLMMGMVLETALQILLYTSNFFPLIHYNGRFGMYYWAGVGFSYITILLITTSITYVLS